MAERTPRAGHATPRAGRGTDVHRLTEIYARLGPKERRSLEDFAAFLDARRPARTRAAAAPVRPANETVVQAIRRLMRASPDLERARLLGETSRCLAQHMVDGREAAVVIAELEAMFVQAREHASAPGRPRR